MIVGVVGVAVAAAIASPFVWAVVRNNSKMDGWRHEFVSIAPPPGSVIENQGSRFGLLDGEGNHCDMEVWIDIRTDRSPSEIEEYYNDQLGESVGLLTVSVLPQGSLRVERADSFEPGWDLRCT
jgi:hypothetical protein